MLKWRREISTLVHQKFLTTEDDPAIPIQTHCVLVESGPIEGRLNTDDGASGARR